MATDKYIEGFKGLAIYQIAGGGLSLVSTVYVAILLAKAGILPGPLALAPVIFFGYSIFCGIALLQRTPGSIQMSLVNQYLQLLSFSGSGFVFKYVAGISLELVFNANRMPLPGVNLSFFTFNLYLNVDWPVRQFALNMIAAGIILILHQELRSIARERIRDEIDSIGSDSI